MINLGFEVSEMINYSNLNIISVQIWQNNVKHVVNIDFSKSKILTFSFGIALENSFK